MKQRILIAILAAVACTSVASAAFHPLWFEVEPNGTIADALAFNHVGTAGAPGAGTSIEGYLHSGDVDWYAFDLADDASYLGAAAFDNMGVGADAQFQLIDTFGTIIEWDDDDNLGFMPALEVFGLPAGTYLLGVSAYPDVTFSTGYTELFDGLDSAGAPTDADFSYKVSIITNVIPEPASLALLALGALLLRRR